MTATPFVQALALGLDPAWRRLPDPERCEDARTFARAGATVIMTYLAADAARWLAEDRP